jgi:oxalate---CoA ligase
VVLQSALRRYSPSPISRPDRLNELIAVRALTSGSRSFAEDARSDRRLCYGDLPQAVRQWSRVLDGLGVPVGSPVGVAIKDPLDFVAAFLGVMGAGRWVAPIDPSAPDAVIADSCQRLALPLVLASRTAPRGVELTWVPLSEGAPGSVEAVTAERSSRSERLDLNETASGGVSLSSSGTSGTPKVISLDEALLLRRAGAIAAHHELSASDRGFNPLPLFHINAEVVGLLSSLVAGSSVVLDDRFHRTGFWELITARAITWINAVPAIIAHLSDRSPSEELPTGVRFIRSASAPLPLATHQRFSRSVGIPILETYGMTEAASQITANPLHGVRKRGSVGKPVEAELRIVPMDHGAEVLDGSGLSRRVGRVEIRGPGVISRYSSPGYEDRFSPGGWLRTGDLGYLDEDGYLFLAGREDDVINRGGFKLMPRDIEEAILTEPSVREVAVVARYDQALGEVPVAFVVLRQDNLEPDDLAKAMTAIERHCAMTLARPGRPAAFHVVKALPTGTNGKLHRRALRQEPVVSLA